MYKIKVFMKRQPHLSFEQFVSHYENWHAPWGYRTFCAQHVRRYMRHYIKHPEGGPEFQFDVITEFWFNTEQDFEAWRKFKEDHVLTKELLEDELSFLDLYGIWVVPIETVEDVAACPIQRPALGV